ncbi:MAG: hypothetical protein JWR87_3789 [Segetibacter sp.]|jgi:hypothetical protein|nr:hypothetical protein [Segetibacter sp.]
MEKRLQHPDRQMQAVEVATECTMVRRKNVEIKSKSRLPKILQ